MRGARAAVVVALATVGPPAAAYSLGAGGAGDQAAPLGPGVVTVRLDTAYSRFSPSRLRVHEGTLVRFIVTNRDPIHHELVVGDDDVHAAHAVGRERSHPPVPGEVSVGPGRRRMTAYRFDAPGTVRYACHLPGHVAYGMEGEVTVVPR